MPNDAASARRRQATIERRERLLRAARDEFARNGLAGATTRTIAAAAGTTETMMYRMSPSKEDLFDEAICDPLEQLVLRIAGMTTEFARTDDTGRTTLDPDVQQRLLTTMIEALPLFGAAIMNQDSGTDFFERRIAPLIDLAIKAVGGLLRSFPNADIDPETLLMAIFGMHMGLAIEATKSDTELDIPAMAAGMVETLTYGLTSP